MKMKLITIFIACCLTGYSQNNVALKTAMQQLYEANFLMDFETIAQYSYPEMVSKSGKENFLQQTELHYENEEYRLRYQLQSVPFQLGAIQKIGGKSFCVISIRTPKRYFFERKLTVEEANAKKAWLQEINNTKEVTFEPNRNSFNVKMVNTFVAVYDESIINTWTFFNLDIPEQKTAFKQLFNEETQQTLGLKK
jgi:hypothetical protein